MRVFNEIMSFAGVKSCENGIIAKKWEGNDCPSEEVVA